MKIAIIGATGHLGSKILNEAVARGHAVTAISRSPERLPDHPAVTGIGLDVHDSNALAAVLRGHDAVITAFSPGRDMSEAPDVFDRFVAGHKAIIAAIKASGVSRVLAVGGAASLKLPNGVTLLDSPDWPPQFNKEAVKGTRELMYLLEAEPGLDWVYLSPSTFLEPGERTGRFRPGKDDLLIDANGRSHISEEDYAVAMIDELEKPKHHRERFTVGY